MFSELSENKRQLFFRFLELQRVIEVLRILLLLISSADRRILESNLFLFFPDENVDLIIDFL